MTDVRVVRLVGRKQERSQHAVPARVPLALRSAVVGTFARGRFGQPWSRRIVLIKWVMAGRAAIGLSGGRAEFGPGEVALHLPDQPHRFWVLSETADMCWFSVDGPLAEAFARHLGLAPGVYAYPAPAPTARVEALEQALPDASPEGWRRASQLAIRMLYEVAATAMLPEVPVQILRARHMIEEQFADPELSVAGIAEELNCHRVTLSVAFRKHAGMSVIDYITQVRLTEALLLLRQSDDPVATVAAKCGFRGPIYFSRWCRKHTGLPPSRIRRDRPLPEPLY